MSGCFDQVLRDQRVKRFVQRLDAAVAEMVELEQEGADQNQRQHDAARKRGTSRRLSASVRVKGVL